MPGADVSVVIPLFDAEGSIERCLRSVASQSLSVREVIVIDDASAVSFEAPRPLPELAAQSQSSVFPATAAQRRPAMPAWLGPRGNT